MIEPVFFKLFFFQKMHQLMSKIKKIYFQLKTVVLNSINLEGQGRQPSAVTAQPPTL
jgi:hypothetical protein